VKELQSELSGNFWKVIKGLMMTPEEFDAECIYKAVKGLGTNEKTLIEVLATRNNEEIQKINAAYEKSK